MVEAGAALRKGHFFRRRVQAVKWTNMPAVECNADILFISLQDIKEEWVDEISEVRFQVPR